MDPAALRGLPGSRARHHETPTARTQPQPHRHEREVSTQRYTQNLNLTDMNGRYVHIDTYRTSTSQT